MGRVVRALSLAALKRESADCRACPLWERATQTVFGDGARHARVMFVGEQPGNEEDLSGKPFVGPAGKLLDKALTEAGIDRKRTYVTNVVKHFKWEPRGKRRIHKKPNAREIAACRPWLDAELELIKPIVVVCAWELPPHRVFSVGISESHSGEVRYSKWILRPMLWQRSIRHRSYAHPTARREQKSCVASSTIYRMSRICYRSVREDGSRTESQGVFGAYLST